MGVFFCGLEVSFVALHSCSNTRRRVSIEQRGRTRVSIFSRDDDAFVLGGSGLRASNAGVVTCYFKLTASDLWTEPFLCLAGRVS